MAIYEIVQNVMQRLPMRRARVRLNKNWRGLPGNVRGGLWMLLGTLFASIMVVLIKLAGQHMHVTQILLLRQSMMLLLALPVILGNFPESLVTALPGLQAVRIFFAFLSMLLGFSAFIHLPLADATTLNFAKTFFIAILAILFLGEVVGARRWAAIIFGFIGVLVVAWPGGEGTQFNVYSGMAILSAMSVAVVMTIMRKIAQVDRPVTILSYQAIGVGILMLPLAMYHWTWPSLNDWLLVAAIAFISSIAQLCNIQAFKAGEASAVAPLDYSRLVYAIIFGYLIFDEWPEPRVFVGAVMIVGAAVYTLHRERVLGRDTIAKAKQNPVLR